MRESHHLRNARTATPNGGGPHPAGRERPSRRSRKTSRELIAAAHDVLDDQGLAGLTVKAVTARADVAHGTFYHHFESAEDVLGAAIETSMRDLAEELMRQHSEATDKAWVVVDSTATLFAMLSNHTALGWMLERPGVMARALRSVLEPYVRQDVEALAASNDVEVGPIDRMASFWPWMMIGALHASQQDAAARRQQERDLVEAMLRLIGLDSARVRGLQERLDARSKRRTPRAARAGARR